MINIVQSDYVLIYSYFRIPEGVQGLASVSLLSAQTALFVGFPAARRRRRDPHRRAYASRPPARRCPA